MSTLSDSEIHSIISELKKSYVSHRQKDFMISAVYDLWKKDNFYIISYSCLKKKNIMKFVTQYSKISTMNIISYLVIQIVFKINLESSQTFILMKILILSSQ